MKNFITLFVFTLFAVNLFAQDTIPNPSFERWTSGSGYMDPTGWASPNAYSIQYGGQPEVTQTNTAYGGNYAVRLETGSVLGFGVPGFILLGTISFAAPYVTGGVPFTKRVDTLYGYYEYMPASGKTDSCLAFAILSRWNPSKGAHGGDDTVAKGFFLSGATVTSYTKFAVPMTYYSGEIPDSIQIAFSSSYKFTSSPPLGSVMFVDSLSFSKDTTAAGINTLADKSFSISCYPNPAKNNFNILISQPKPGMIIKVYDVLGKNLLSVNSSGSLTSLDVSNFSTGAYFYEVADVNGNVLKTEKFTVTR